MIFQRISTLGVILLFFFSCSTPAPRWGERAVAKNIIYFIGDGMGVAQMSAGRLFAGGSFKKMNYERLPVVGLSKTYSSREFTTDSAAAASALASGVKTYNGAIAMTDPEWEDEGRSRKLQTLFDLAKEEGKSVGIVTNTRLTHATPAAFFAHASMRDQESEIAAQVLGSDIDLMIGGGARFFLPQSEGGVRVDEKNIFELREREGALVVRDLEKLEEVRDLSRPLLAVLADDHLPYVAQGATAGTLENLVLQAVELLSQNPRGYFLMVEGGRVDHAAHLNLEREFLTEMLELDRALGSAMKRTAAKDTLIILTADHETGGLAINGYGPHEQARGESLLGPTLERNFKHKPRPILTWATGPGAALSPLGSAAHTALDVIVGARGPGQELFGGWMDNNEIAWKIAQAMNRSFTDKANLKGRRELQKRQKEVEQ